MLRRININVFDYSCTKPQHYFAKSNRQHCSANTENLYFGVSRNVKLINVVAELVALHCKSDELYWEHSVLQ